MSVVILCVLAAASFVQPAAAGNVPRAYAGIVVDAKSGKVLYAEAADAPRYPASVTKVMTLYVLFQELAAGNLTLRTEMRVSKHAAAAVPTKLYLKPGTTIRVEDAIKALVTLSANDVARVIAEHISGSESAFAKRMTQTARQLGMSRTTYSNASGLPDSRQVTTVRDQARLGIAIYQHFPKYYEYFQTRSFSYGGKTHGNHNRLLGQHGVDGIKTGYINASGYNLLTAARRDNRHIVVAAFGFNSGASRNAKVASLVKKYMPKGRSGDYLQVARIPQPGSGRGVFVAAAPVTPMPRPADRGIAVDVVNPPVPIAVADMPEELIPTPVPAAVVPGSSRSAIEAATRVANAGEINAPAPQERPVDVIGAWISEHVRLGPDSGATSAAAPGPVPPVAIGGSAPGRVIDLLTSGSTDKPANDNEPVSSAWIVQIGAAPSETGAQSLISDAASRINDLGGYRPYVERFEKSGQVFYRARFAGFGDRDQALTMCNLLKQEKMSCLAVQS